jgi:hypothetical protein
MYVRGSGDREVDRTAARPSPALGDTPARSSTASRRRELLVGSYRLIYEVGKEIVYVLGLIHGASDLPALWGEETRRGSAES